LTLIFFQLQIIKVIFWFSSSTTIQYCCGSFNLWNITFLSVGSWMRFYIYTFNFEFSDFDFFDFDFFQLQILNLFFIFFFNDHSVLLWFIQFMKYYFLECYFLEEVLQLHFFDFDFFDFDFFQVQILKLRFWLSSSWSFSTTVARSMQGLLLSSVLVPGRDFHLHLFDFDFFQFQILKFLSWFSSSMTIQYYCESFNAWIITF